MGLYQTPLLIASLLLCIGSPTGVGAKHSCPPSSCGNLQIRYPFRLKGDKPKCGDRRYELTCDGNRTIIDINSGKYYVKSISYSVGDEHIQIIDVDLASGGCAFPSKTLSIDTITHDKRFTPNWRDINELQEASFVNCKGEIQGAYRYVPCQSGSNASVHVIFYASVGNMPPNCRFLAMVPTNGWFYGETDEEAFKYLQNGISLKWANPSWDSVPSIVKYCYAVAWGGPDYASYTRQRQDDYTSRGQNDYIRPYEYYTTRYYTTLWYFLYWAIGVYQTNFFSCLDSAPDCLFNSVIFLLIKGFTVLIYALSFLALARILVRLILSILAVLALLVYKCHKMRVPTDAVEKFLIDQQSLTPTRYTYTDIIVMTRNFKDKIGQGGFGSVYKGKLPSGFQVAIKILGNSKCNGDDFISEVSTIGTIHHINIVRLVGFCSEGSKRALVYEYLPKGSLDKYIFSSEPANQRPFTLDKLIDIALGIARGIDYLHRGCNMRILHFDIKPPNILLDNSFNPKVSDFGLAKLFPKDYSLVALSAARGTIGYIAPELVSRSFGIISYKSDVYSFGMLLMEMAGGRRNVELKAENTNQIYYPSWIYDQLDDQRDMQGIVRDVAPIGEIESKLSIVGLWCIQTRPSERPSMSRVIEMLQAEVGTLQMPPKPFLSAGRVCSMSIRDPSTEASTSTLTAISEQESLT